MPARVFRMSSNPLDQNSACVVGNDCFKSVIVTADIEDNYVVRQKTGAGISFSDVVTSFPLCALGVGDPVVDPIFSVRVLLNEGMQ